MALVPRKIRSGAFGAALVVALFATAPVAAWATPTLLVTPTRFQPGATLQLDLSGFSPGGYDATIFFDGASVATVHIPPSGEASLMWTTPAGLALGGHDIVACAACGQGDIEERTNNVRATAFSNVLTGTEFNLQVWGIEVTQGVRGDFPVRTPPDGSLVLADPGVVHVANRRTIVRVYPWVEGGPLFSTVSNVDARLWVIRGGATYGPFEAETPRLPQVRADATMEELRSNLARTWNFVVTPDVLILLSGSASFDLHVEINPAGPYHRTECTGCPSDNDAFLFNNVIRTVGQVHGPFALSLRPHLVEADVTQDDGSILHIPRPTTEGLTSTIAALDEMLPVGAGAWGIDVYPSRDVYWSGTSEGWDPDQDNDLIDRFLPGGELTSEPENDFYGFFYAPGGCAGHARLHTPFFRVSADPPPCKSPAHELNHAIGAAHAGYLHGEDDGGGHDPAYPNALGAVEPNTWGINVFDLTLKPPTVPDGGPRYDFMSYGNNRESWVSRYSWNLTAENLGTPGIDPGLRAPAGPMAALGASATEDDVAFRGVLRDGAPLDLAPFYTTYAPDGGEGDGRDVLEFRDANGATLGVHALRPFISQDAVDGSMLFAESITLPAGWKEMRLSVDSSLVRAWTRSDSVPSVSMVSPAPGFQWPRSGMRTLSWSGSDADGGPLTYRILAQHQASGEIFLLATGLTAGTFDLDLSTLPAGGAWTLAVEATDGFNHKISDAVNGQVDPSKPQALILRPRNGAVEVAGSNVPAKGIMVDLQGQVPDTNLHWYLDGSFAGTGSAFELPAVTMGLHQLMLVTYNAYQLADSEQVEFQVVKSLPPPTLLTPVDGSPSVQLPAVLTWSAVPGAISYRIQVAADPGFQNVIREVGNVADSSLSADGLPSGKPAFWRVLSEHRSSPSAWSPAHSFTPKSGTTAVPPGASGTLAFAVYPNPIQGPATIAFDLPEAGDTSVEIFDLAGRRVRSLARGRHAAGRHEVKWDATDDRGASLSAGVYLARLTTPLGTRTRNLLIIR